MAEEKLDFERSIVELEKKIEELKKFTESKKIDFSEEIRKLEAKSDKMKKEVYDSLTPWQRTQVARHLQRPRTLDYIGKVFDWFIPLHGDRAYRDDPAVVGGLAMLNDIAVVVVGLQKGKDTKDNIFRNFGMAHPEGYRKALRLMQMAEKFNKPVISFVDTPAAYPGVGAEERGQAEAIARNLREMSGLKVPIIIVIHGEGGSGGALGIAVGDKILMLENAIYSVIPPEGCAAILWNDSSKAGEAAAMLKLTAVDLFELQVIDEIIKEPAGGTHRNYDKTAKEVKDAIIRNLKECVALDREELLEKRYKKFRNMGKFLEITEESVKEELS